jgi:uncharacterized protein YbaA (DUF1428 family)
MSYIDGFVFPIRQDNVAGYTEMVQKTADLWLEHGALEYVEAIAEDLSENGYTMSFNNLVKQESDETIGFAYIIYKSREHRDEVNAKVMADERLHKLMDMNNPLISCSKMAFSGFSSIVSKKI